MPVDGLQNVLLIGDVFVPVVPAQAPAARRRAAYMI
jgi:hypothetical protein